MSDITVNITTISTSVNVTDNEVSVAVSFIPVDVTLNFEYGVSRAVIDSLLTKENITGLESADSPGFTDVIIDSLKSSELEGGEVPATIYNWFKSIYLSLVDSSVKSWIIGIVTILKDLADAVAALQDAIDNVELLPGADAPHVQFQYSANNSDWHTDYADGDMYFHTSTDGGTTWGSGVYFKGPTGNSAYEDWLNVSGNSGKTFEEFLQYLQGGNFTISLNFAEVLAYTFICPQAMQINTVETNTSGATVAITKGGVNYTLGTALAQFDALVITPSVAAFFNLNAITL